MKLHPGNAPIMPQNSSTPTSLSLVERAWQTSMTFGYLTFKLCDGLRSNSTKTLFDLVQEGFIRLA